MNVARNDSGTANTLVTRRLCIRVLDVSGPDGKPWTDLQGRPLDLIWVISRGDTVVCRGTVSPEGWIVARINPQTDGGTLRLRVGPRAAGAQPSGVQGPDAEFAWCEKYELADPPLVYTPQEWLMLTLDRIGYHAGKEEPVRHAALVHFQREHDMTVTGTLDAATMKAIDQEMNKLLQDALKAQGTGR
jgi:hypothetical protein